MLLLNRGQAVAVVGLGISFPSDPEEAEVE